MKDRIPNERIREARGTLSREEAAKLIGISLSSLIKYEMGDRTPRDEVKVRMAKVYGKTVQELFF